MSSGHGSVTDESTTGSEDSARPLKRGARRCGRFVSACPPGPPDGVVVQQLGACAHGVEQATIAERSHRPGTLRDLVIAFTATGFSRRNWVSNEKA